VAPGTTSLRMLIDKWLAPASALQVRVSRVRRGPAAGRHPCVLVETVRPSGALSLFFFRHDDGSWCVFPPERRVTHIDAYRLAA